MSYRYFIARDGDSEPTLWRQAYIARDGDSEPTLWRQALEGLPVAIIRQCDNPEAWSLLVAGKFANYANVRGSGVEGQNHDYESAWPVTHPMHTDSLCTVCGLPKRSPLHV